MYIQTKLNRRQQKQFDAALVVIKPPTAWFIFKGGQINFLPGGKLLVVANYSTGLGWLQESKNNVFEQSQSFVLVDEACNVKELTNQDLDSVEDSFCQVAWDY